MDGVLNLLKPPGMTSSNAVADVRRLFHEKKVGHTGTLDPGAAGVLPICLGKATRLFDYLLEKDKVYVAEVTFGLATDTLDSYGQVTGREETAVTEEQIKAVLPAFLGEQTQIPPMYSALKLNGQKLYELARQGETIDLEQKQRIITIHSLQYITQTGPQSFLIRICCTKGTYIRTLCGDIGARLGVPAYMSFLLRERSGGFGVENAYSIKEVEQAIQGGRAEELLTPMSEALDFLRAVHVDEPYFDKLKNGNTVPFEETEGAYRVFCRGEFFGIGTVQNQWLHMKTMLFSDPGRKD